MNLKVIFHIDKNQKWDLFINNVKNLLSSYEGKFSDSSIEILANSEAVEGYVVCLAGNGIAKGQYISL